MVVHHAFLLKRLLICWFLWLVPKSLNCIGLISSRAGVSQPHFRGTSFGPFVGREPFGNVTVAATALGPAQLQLVTLLQRGLRGPPGLHPRAPRKVLDAAEDEWPRALVCTLAVS